MPLTQEDPQDEPQWRSSGGSKEDLRGNPQGDPSVDYQGDPQGDSQVGEH